MNVSPESVSNPAATGTGRTAEPRILVSGLSWLGDSLMCMPALRELKRRTPDAHITVLSKPGLVPLWKMCPDIDDCIMLTVSFPGTISGASAVAQGNFDRAFILPHSFRSALIPFLGRVPERIGMPGHSRNWMLTSVLPYERTETKAHQRYEYMHLMGIEECDVPSSLLSPPSDAVESARQALQLESGPVIGICPGARYGPAKRWPAEHFAAAAEKIIEQTGRRAAVFGAESEAEACAEVIAHCSKPVLDMCGKTSLPEFAAMLSLCDAVVANDSGSMHIAAAVGTPVAAVFGITDSSITGPMGSSHRIIRAKGVEIGRDLARDSREARQALASISPDDVFSELQDILKETEK